MISISPKPVLTELGRYCYVVKMELTSKDIKLMPGLRGIARVEGEKVSLGYYLFKNVILWWRKV